ncbi:multidrug transporter MatE [Endozoicomonas montiporae]|uniref:Multidrug export protein MepA n=2 Tax=Endozoicomonas montiporae TaxID=1027273 RepID=A0A081N5G3_9GAMM|nr:MATE family efflux transporter [Endozoicomonas montiporae]AMO57429.1 Na+ driven multidrug efflux pump [Endozoicomonas montiporae CL-33]KEQ13686.1 multidrug transporter MatE [Endozoicomonas montiporae]
MARKSIDLKNDPIKQSFFRYLMPAITGMVIKSIFIMVDTIFIGRGVGADGLAAISMAVPFFSFFTAIAMMIGIGGSALMSIEFGKGNYQAGQGLFVQSVLLAILVAGGLALGGQFWLDDILALVGATGQIAIYSGQYLGIMLNFFVLYSLGWVLSCFVRNDTNPALTMYALAGGALMNIVLDYLFIMQFGWGVQGAAYATIIANLISMIILLIHFLTRRGRLRFNLSGMGLGRIRRILTIGLPIFFIESSVAATSMVFNTVLLAKGGLYISVYSIVLNTAVLTLFILVGIGQACQPIISFNYGAGAVNKVKETLFIGLRFAVATGFAAVAIVWLEAESIASLFVVDNPQLVAMAAVALRYYFLAYPFMGFNLMVANLFQATERSASATVLSLARGFVLVVVGLLVIPVFLSEHGVWLSLLFAEAVTVVFSLLMLRRYLQPSTTNVVTPAMA